MKVYCFCRMGDMPCQPPMICSSECSKWHHVNVHTFLVSIQKCLGNEHLHNVHAGPSCIKNILILLINDWSKQKSLLLYFIIWWPCSIFAVNCFSLWQWCKLAYHSAAKSSVLCWLEGFWNDTQKLGYSWLHIPLLQV